MTRRFRELEVELLEGDERTLRQLEKELRRAGADLDRASCSRSSTARSTWPGPSRPGRARRARRPARRSGSRSRPSTWRCSPTIPAPAGATIPRICTSSGSRRAACGRSSAPRARSSTSDWATSLRAELGWLGGHLGPARDLDVMLGRLRAEVAALGGRRRRRARPARGARRGARGRLRATSSRRSAATATSRCSTGSRPRRRRR